MIYKPGIDCHGFRKTATKPQTWKRVLCTLLVPRVCVNKASIPSA